MIRYLLSLMPFVPRFAFPLGAIPVPLIRQGRISGVRAAKRQAKKRRNRRKARHV
ncbi:MAG TPA: hypothetical protein VJ603_00820 [Paucimonas sp.]|nr:hypothetical protein [Paucimonas sp.]